MLIQEWKVKTKMSYQLSTLRSRIQDKLDNTAFSSSVLTQFLNDGLRDLVIQAKPNYYQSEATYTTTASANTLTTSATDVLVPISFRLYTPINYASLLPYVEYRDVDLVYPNLGLLGVGPPIAWTMYGMVPSLVNNADTTYTLKSKYVTIPAELVNDTDVPLWPVTFSELLVLSGYKRALEHDGDFDQAQIIQQDITSKLMDMETMLKPQLGVPHIMRNVNRRRRLGTR